MSKKYCLGVNLVVMEPKNHPTSGAEGFSVTYPDGYVSWIPKEAKESRYIELVTTPEEAERDELGIRHADIENFILDESYLLDHVTYNGEPVKRNLISTAVLSNGFVITNGSTSVNDRKFDEEIGRVVCHEAVLNKVWEYLGFLLQWGVNGLKR